MFGGIYGIRWLGGNGGNGGSGGIISKDWLWRVQEERRKWWIDGECWGNGGNGCFYRYGGHEVQEALVEARQFGGALSKGLEDGGTGTKGIDGDVSSKFCTVETRKQWKEMEEMEGLFTGKLPKSFFRLVMETDAMELIQGRFLRGGSGGNFTVLKTFGEVNVSNVCNAQMKVLMVGM